jgi:hypothetical protein
MKRGVKKAIFISVMLLTFGSLVAICGNRFHREGDWQHRGWNHAPASCMGHEWGNQANDKIRDASTSKDKNGQQNSMVTTDSLHK